MARTNDPELLTGFFDEVTGYVPAMRAGLERFLADSSAPEALDEPYRFAHSIHGTSSMLGRPELSRLAARIEEVIEQLADGRRTHDGAVLESLILAVVGIGEYARLALNQPSEAEALAAEAYELLQAGTTDALSVATDPASENDTTPIGSEVSAVTLPDLDLPPIPEMPEPSEFVSDPSHETPDVPAELLEVFRLEADDHMRSLTTLLPECRRDPTDRDRWAEVRRAAHTLKGAAAMVGFENVTRLAHRMEDLLDTYYEGTRVATPAEIDLLLAGTDTIEDMIRGKPSAIVATQLSDQFTLLLGTKPNEAPIVGSTSQPEVVEDPAETPERTTRSETYVRVPIERLNEVVKLVGELVIARSAFEQRLREYGRLIGELDPSTSRLRRASGRIEAGYEATALLDGERRGGGPGWALASRDTDSSGSFEFDFLEMDRYTEFHLLSRELAETTNDIQMVTGELGHLQTDFDGLLTRQSRLSSELEDKLMRLRMVPLSSMASRLERTVRTTARQAGKQVELRLEGERTGLDKTVLEAMADPLLHLLRNAIDHGLESIETRTALGKSATGLIHLKAEQEGSQIVLTIRDDGRGIDAESVRQTLILRGLLSADQAAALTHEQIFAYLFVPGFSTREEVTELSGRGVGLDVVRTTVLSLKGSVTIDSVVGRGTTFTIRLPMTLALTRALLVRVNQQTFAIPLDAVEQIVRLEDATVSQVGSDQLLEVNQKLYPIVSLASVLKLRTPPDDSVSRRPALLLKADGRQVALVIDRLLGGREIVVKTLTGQPGKIPAVSGATLLGDGSVVLILNPSTLVKSPTGPTSTPNPVEAPPVARPRDGVSVLIVDDSPSVRRVLTALIQRVGWRPVAVKDGLEALELLQRGVVQPDIALMDIEMPRMDGYELLATLRGQSALAQLPVVMITSRAGEKHRQKALELGASAYLVKPYQDDTLIDVIRQLTRTGR